MASQDATRAARTVAAAGLVLLAGIALRGYVPGAPPPAPEPDADNPFAMIVNIVMLVAAVGVVALAAVARARQREPVRAASTERPDWLRADASTSAWRTALILAGVVAAWLAVALVLSRIGGHATPNPGAVPAPSAPDAAPGTTTPPPSDTRALPEPPGESPLLGWFYAMTVAFLLVLVVGSFVTRRRRPTADVVPSDGVAQPAAGPEQPESLARAAELALAAVEDASRDPRAAIIACYAAMERELSRVPGAVPQDFDTASEVLARAVAQHALGPDTATQLVDLFDEARFSPHVMNEGHRDLASRALQRVLEELKVGSC